MVDQRRQTRQLHEPTAVAGGKIGITEHCITCHLRRSCMRLFCIFVLSTTLKLDSSSCVYAKASPPPKELPKRPGYRFTWSGARKSAA
jgi:hypothetical protein